MVESGIFISYRREDSAGHAGRLYDRLSAHFGEEKIFMDVGIEPGVDFVDQLEEAVASCDVLLVLIGPEWLTADDGRRRLEEEGDFVHLEVSAALERDIRVIPLLVHGATMPAAHDLPSDLARLARRNALELSDARWRYDVGRLIEVLDRLLERPAPDTPAREAEVAREPASRSAPEPEPEPRDVPDSKPVSRGARAIEAEAVAVPAEEPASRRPPEPEPPEPEPTSSPPLPPARSHADRAGDAASARGTERHIHRTRRRSPLLAAAGVAAAVIVAIALAAGQILGGDKEQAASGGVSEAPPNVVELGADSGPDGVAVDADSVYVTESRRGTVARIDRRTGELDAERAEVGADPDSIASGAGALWITSTADDRLYAFPFDGSKSTSVGTESRPEGVAVDGDNVWVANSRSGTASRFRLPDLTQNDYDVGEAPQDVTVGAPGIVWVSNSRDGTVTRINTRPGEELYDFIDVGGTPRGIAKDRQGEIWVVDNSGDRVVEIGPVRDGSRAEKEVRVGDSPVGVAVADGIVWVTNSADDTVTRIDARTRRRIGKPLAVGDRPIGVAARDGVAWVANFSDGTVSRLAPAAR